MAALCLLGSLATALLPSNSIGHRPPTSGTRLQSLQTILMCDLAGSEQPPALLSGRRVVEGDLLVHKDAESQAWWRAVAREVVGNRVLVHYAGCDPYWDAWVDIDEMTLMHMDSNERAKEAGAFQSEEYESSMDNEAVLKEMRKKRWEDNSRWQINVFARCCTPSGVFAKRILMPTGELYMLSGRNLESSTGPRWSTFRPCATTAACAFRKKRAAAVALQMCSTDRQVSSWWIR